jgi:O-antigen ligase
MPGSSSAAWKRAVRAAFSFLAVAFLLVNLVVRGLALYAGAGRGLTAGLAVAGLLGAAGLCLARPALLGVALQLFGTAFLLFGFHSYRVSSQVLELVVTALALVLVLRPARKPDSDACACAVPLGLLASYAAVATLSLLLLPIQVLEHRLFLEAGDFGRAVLNAFPKDPLYPIASVARLWLFALFALLLATRADGRALYRRLFRGVAWASILAAVLGLLDFLEWLPLESYNLSRLFYGARYRRLQSTFGNPSWFACYVTCALPFVLLEFRESVGRSRLALAFAFPLCAASLLMSGARAAWLAVAVVTGLLLFVPLVTRSRNALIGRPDAAGWLAFGSTLVTLALLAVTAIRTPAAAAPGGGAPGKLEGLSREMQYRGLGLTSPRRVAIAYAIELARLKPLLGLGYESFNMHLRAQLEQPASGLARVVNTAVAADPTETLFDDSHNTYLQVLTGTGLLGLALWIAAAASALLAAWRAFRSSRSPEALAVLLGLVTFHFYGLFQGMAYIPVTFLLGVALAGYASVLEPSAEAVASRGRIGLLLMGVLLAAAAFGYASDNGYRSIKRRFAVTAYLPDESAEFEGFYRPEIGPAGEFRWMARRGIVNLTHARPFRLRFGVASSEVEREPLVLTLRFEGQELEPVVFRHAGEVERRFSLPEAGALRLAVSRTLPHPGDPRELGVAVSAIRWE